MIDFNNLPNLDKETPENIARFLIHMISLHIPNSSTKLSLRPEGYPVEGEIETTIRAYQQKYSGLETGYHALQTGCGNCQDMAYAAALILRAAGYEGELAIGEFGINHRFLFVGDMIVEPWSEMYCPKEDWRNNLTAYGGSIKGGIMKGRILPSSHEELEGEKPEIVEHLPIDVEPILKKYKKTTSVYGEAINKTLFSPTTASDKVSSSNARQNNFHV